MSPMNTNICEILWNKSVIGLAELAPDGSFRRANLAFCELLGYSEAELQKRSWEEITHPDDVRGEKEMIQKVLSRDVSGYTMEKRYITKRGNIIWTAVNISPMIDSEGTVKILLKQVVSTPVVVTSPNEKPKSTFLEENYKVVLAASVGTVMTIAGAILKVLELQNLGIALTVGVFGGFLSKK